jgi:glutaredoxin
MDSFIKFVNKKPVRIGIAVSFCIVVVAIWLKMSLGTDYSAADIEIFVADFCGYCKKLKPEIEKLTVLAPQHNLKLKVYVMEQDPVIMDVREIISFPTIIVRGNTYTGERTAEAIVAEASKS